MLFRSDYLETFEIRYIFIDEEMRRGLVWRRSQEGLLFLLENSEKFINIYSEAGIDIYLYGGGT